MNKLSYLAFSGYVVVCLGFVGFGVHKGAAPKETAVQVDTMGAMVGALRVCYPKLTEFEVSQYAIIFQYFAYHYKFPWEVYPAVVYVESQFRPAVKSKRNAKGLMQIMERTAEAQCKKLGIHYAEDTTLWNDLHNLHIGIDYLSCDYAERGSDAINPLEWCIKKYVAGPEWEKNKNPKTVEYTNWYYETVRDRYRQVHYTFLGKLHECQ